MRGVEVCRAVAGPAIAAEGVLVAEEHGVSAAHGICGRRRLGQSSIRVIKYLMQVWGVTHCEPMQNWGQSGLDQL